MKSIYASIVLNHFLTADQEKSGFNVRFAKNGLMKNAHQAYNSLFVNCVLYPIIFKKPNLKTFIVIN